MVGCCGGPEDADLTSEWRSKAKHLEQQWMVLKDQYSEVAVALGFEPKGLWGDPLETHEEVVKRARELRQKVLSAPLDKNDGP